jgi:hypothetical protein
MRLRSALMVSWGTWPAPPPVVVKNTEAGSASAIAAEPLVASRPPGVSPTLLTSCGENVRPPSDVRST